MCINTFHLKWIVLLPKIKTLGAVCDLSASQLSQGLRNLWLSQPGSISWIRTGLAVLVNRQIINCSHNFFFLDLSHCIWGENRWNPSPPYFLVDSEAKGQLISKCLLGVFTFFQKTNKSKSTSIKLNLFIHSLEEKLAWRNHFEFIWSLQYICSNFGLF